MAVVATPKAEAQQYAAAKSRRRTMNRLGLIGLQILMTVILITFLGPTIWMVSSSLKTPNEIFAVPIVWLPQNPQWGNYAEAMSLLPFGRFALNTFKISIVSVIGVTLSAAMVAYSFARLRWPGRDFFFGMLLGTMMLPEIITLIPMFIQFRVLGWTKPGNVLGLFPPNHPLGFPLNYLPLTVPFWLALAPLYVFLMRQFFKSIPMELEEAALVDGASRFRILFNIILP
ncbi:MAG: carbohydrate ABC transporter permease, partial [Anaerolineae bacterium]|nr:carbohydrate ABC transporter permease [Anaerolineae bacterium]